MKIASLQTLAITLTLLSLAACRSKGESAAKGELVAEQMIVGGNDVGVIPNATVFRMSGDYADKVAVTLDAEGNLLYYPAPSDLTRFSAPYPLGGGWYLNRQGIGPSSVFTSYTFEEYSRLDRAPSPQQIKAAVIPGAFVTDFEEIPVLHSTAVQNPGVCKEFLPADE